MSGTAMVREKVGMLRRSLGPLRHRRGGAGVSGSGWVSGSPSKNDSEKKEWGRGSSREGRKFQKRALLVCPLLWTLPGTS